MNEQFQKRIQTVIEKFDILRRMPPLKRDSLPRDVTCGGVYLFSDEVKHYYVGRSRNVRERILQHSRPSVLDAPFSFRRAREILVLPATYTTEGSRRQLLADEKFFNTVQEQKSWIKTLDIRFVIEADPTNQALLEVYASDVLQTPYNDFNTN